MQKTTVSLGRAAFSANPAFAFHYAAVPQPVYRHVRGLSLVLLCALYRLAGQSALVQASRPRLAAETGIPEKKIPTYLAKLEEGGWLLRQGGNGGRSRAGSVWLTIPERFADLRRVETAPHPVPKPSPNPDRNHPQPGGGHKANPILNPAATPPALPAAESSPPAPLPAPLVADDLALPSGLSLEQAAPALAELPPERHQQLLDEYVGVEADKRRRGDAVRNPGGFLRILARQLRDGAVPEFAPRIARAREQARRTLASLALPPVSAPTVPPLRLDAGRRAELYGALKRH